MNKIKLLLITLILTVGFQASAQQSSGEVNHYGADQYGMKKYVMAFLKRGPNRDSLSKEQRQTLQRQHMENIARMAKEKQLVLAGPFLDDGQLRGIYIFNTTSLEQAKDWTETDPAIKAGSLVLELKPWYGSAAIMAVNDLHNKISASSK